jgi:hypothetical protein
MRIAPDSDSLSLSKGLFIYVAQILGATACFCISSGRINAQAWVNNFRAFSVQAPR